MTTQYGTDVTRFEWKEAFVIEQFWREGDSTGLYVYDRIGKSHNADTTGWLLYAKKFRFKWTAWLWNVIYNQSYWAGCQWFVVKHGWVQPRKVKWTR